MLKEMKHNSYWSLEMYWLLVAQNIEGNSLAPSSAEVTRVVSHIHVINTKKCPSYDMDLH